jgi:hypothetical protein
MDIAKNMALTLCIISGLCGMTWATLWMFSKAIDEWLKANKLRQDFIAWFVQRDRAKAKAKHDAEVSLRLSQTNFGKGVSFEEDKDATWPPTYLAASLNRWEDFRAIDIGEKYKIWEVHGLRDGEWFNVFDLDAGQAIAEFARDALKSEKRRLSNAN